VFIDLSFSISFISKMQIIVKKQKVKTRSKKQKVKTKSKNKK